MPHEFVLTDVDTGAYRESIALGPRDGIDLGTDASWRVTKRRLRGGLSDGVDVVEIDNGTLAVSVLPTRGMGLWRAVHGDVPIGWDSPVKRPVHPAFVDQSRRGGIGWLDGFNELLCRCGLASNGPPCDDNGEPLTLHGRIANLPAHRVVLHLDPADGGTLRLVGTVDELGMFGTSLRLTSELSTTAGSNRIAIADTVTNVGSKPAELELLYHVNVGPPFLEAGGSFRAPMAEVTPRDDRAAEGIETWDEYGPPESGYAEQVYFGSLREREPGWSTALLRNAAGDRGLSLDVNVAELPHFSLWKNTCALEDGYVTGLEPSTSLPNPRPVERDAGRVLVLAPGESRSFHLSLGVHLGAEEVAAVESAIEAVP